MICSSQAKAAHVYKMTNDNPTHSESNISTLYSSTLCYYTLKVTGNVKTGMAIYSVTGRELLGSATCSQHTTIHEEY